jgi:hypothetical protein
MKYVLMVVSFMSLGVPVTYAAASGQDKIYKALNAEETVVDEGMVGARKTKKEIGGMVCLKTTVVHPNAKPSYSCALRNDYDAKKVYDALDAKEELQNSRTVGSATFVKKVGPLVCSKSQAVVPNPVPSYSCVMGRTSGNGRSGSVGGSPAL